MKVNQILVNKATNEEVKITNMADKKVEILLADGTTKVLTENTAKKYYVVKKDETPTPTETPAEETPKDETAVDGEGTPAETKPVETPAPAKRGVEQNADIQTLHDNLIAEMVAKGNIAPAKQPKYTGLYFGEKKKNIVELHLNKTSLKMHLRAEALSPEQIKVLHRVVPADYGWALDAIYIAKTKEDFAVALDLLTSGYNFENNKILAKANELKAKEEAKAKKEQEKADAKAKKEAEKKAKEEAKAKEKLEKEQADAMAKQLAEAEKEPTPKAEDSAMTIYDDAKQEA